MAALRVLGSLAVIVGALGCGEKPAVREGEPAAPPSAPPVVDIVANDFAFIAPDTITGGVVTLRLRNDGQEFHHALLIRLEQGKTLPDLLETMKHPGPPPAWATPVGGPNTPEPGGGFNEATLDLAPGDYALLCVIPSADGVPHVAKGMERALTVVGPAGQATPPAADIELTLVDYDFQFSKPLTPGHHTIRVKTSASQPHEILVVKLEPGKTAEEFAAFAEKPVGPPPGRVVGGVTPFGGDVWNVFSLDLEAGEYALFCFIPDVGDGQPHVAHGMMKKITIGAA